MRTTMTLLAAALTLVVTGSSTAGPIEDLLKDLNASRSVAGTDEVKSYATVFDAYLELDAPPFPISQRFNLMTIHPGMSSWDEVSAWAESNPGLAEALLAVEERTLFGLPYGVDNVSEEYRTAGLFADIGSQGTLQSIDFPYLDAMSVISAYATAESYRLMEAGDTSAGLDIVLASIFFVRQSCDREFFEEELYGVNLLNGSLAVMRELCWAYLDKLDPAKLTEIAKERLPFLRPDRGRLFMPEGDSLVAAALIREVFNAGGQPDREKFAEAFAGIQSKETPLTRFGAARRWRMVADVHDSLEASLDRLRLVYDDWWRRWRVQEHDPILDIPTEYERTNEVRYAAVIFSMQDVNELMDARNLLIANHHGAEIAAALAAYQRTLSTAPADVTMTYSTHLRKRSDSDPYDSAFGPFRYQRTSTRQAINAPQGRVWVPAGTGVLYSRGRNGRDDYDPRNGWEHNVDGSTGDIVIWPPVRGLLRASGMIE